MATAKPDMSIIWSAAGSNVKPSDAKIQEGWVAEKPPFQTENWIQERQDQYLKHIDERGVPEWDNKSEYLINSIVWYNNLLWNSLQTPNIGNVPTDGLGFWQSQSNVDSRGDIMTGLLVLADSIENRFISNAPSTGQYIISSGLVKRCALELNAAGAGAAIRVYSVGNVVNDLSMDTLGNMTHLGRTVWDSGNDGPSSGLNADLLDGFHASDLTAGLNGSFEFASVGTFSVPIPAGVNVVFISGCGAGQGGQGGGDGGSCSTGGTPSSGGETDIVGSRQSLFLGGGNGNSARIVTAISSNGFTIPSFSIGMTPDGGGANPVRGGHGAPSLYGSGGVSTASFGGPLAQWHGTRGGGGAGGGGQDGLGGQGGASGKSVVAVPFPVTPGENVQIVVRAGTGGTSGCRSTGGTGGNGYLKLEW